MIQAVRVCLTCSLVALDSVSLDFAVLRDAELHLEQNPTHIVLSGATGA